MDTELQERRVADLVLFFLGGIAGTFFALRWSRMMSDGPPSIERVQAVLDETVVSVESAASAVRSFVAPLHDILDEAGAIAARTDRAVDAYRRIGREREPIPVAVPTERTVGRPS
jgi:hypothetical protein